MGIQDLITVLLFALSPLVFLAVIYLTGTVSKSKKMAASNIVEENPQAEPALSPAD
jgi:hypothetical protein